MSEVRNWKDLKREKERLKKSLDKNQNKMIANGISSMGFAKKTQKKNEIESEINDKLLLISQKIADKYNLSPLQRSISEVLFSLFGTWLQLKFNQKFSPNKTDHKDLKED